MALNSGVLFKNEIFVIVNAMKYCQAECVWEQSFDCL